MHEVDLKRAAPCGVAGERPGTGDGRDGIGERDLKPPKMPLPMLREIGVSGSRMRTVRRCGAISRTLMRMSQKGG